MNGRCCLCTSLVLVFHLGLDRVVSPEQNTAIGGKRVELGIQFQLRGIILHVSLKFNGNIFFLRLHDCTESRANVEKF